MLASLLFVLGTTLAADTSMEAAATATANDLAAGIQKSLGKKPKLIVLGGIQGASGLGDGFEPALLSALRKQGLTLADPAGVREAIREAVVSGAGDGALGEVAAAFGGQVLITGRIDKTGGTLLVNSRAIDTASGKVLASASASYAAKAGGNEVEARSLQAELRRLSDLLAKGVDELPGEARYQRFAVMTFEEVGQNTKDKQLGTLIAAELTTLLHRDHGLMMVERSQLAQVLSELSLGQTGLTDEKTSVEVGKLTGAQALIVGNVSEAGDRYLVDARVVSVLDAQVVYAAQAQLPAADLVALSSEAVVLRTRGGAVYRSLLLPGWGQLYNRQGEKGAVFAGAEVVAAAAATYFHFQGKKFDDKYDNLKPGGDFDGVRADAETNYRRRNLAIYSAIAIHAVQILDALWNGRSFDSATPTGSSGLGATPSY